MPKRDLAAVVQVAFEQEHIKIAQGLPYEDVFKEELKNFGRKIDPKTAHDSYGTWREGQHDDLVLAAALALWGGDHKLKRRKVFEDWLAPAPLPPHCTVKKISDTLEEITCYPSTEEELQKSQKGPTWQDLAYRFRR